MNWLTFCVGQFDKTAGNDHGTEVLLQSRATIASDTLLHPLEL